MELLLPIGLALYIFFTQPKGERPPTRLNPNFYHDENTFCQRYNRIVSKGGQPHK